VRPIYVLAGAAILLVCTTGCTGSEGGAERAGGEQVSLTIDEEDGTYRGVGLGDSSADAEQALGRGVPATLMTSVVPLAVEPSDHQGPVAVYGPSPRSDSELMALRYREVSIGIAGDRVISIDTLEAGATTARGVAIGDPLDDAQAAYPELECESLDDGSWRACHGRLGSRYIWFGGDPIRDITIASVRLDG
jgi:hypothetical protein